MIFFASIFGLVLTKTAQGQNSSNDSLLQRLEALEERLQEEKLEREKLKREAQIQKDAAEKYRKEYEESLKSSRKRRKERRAGKLRPYEPQVFRDIPDSLNTDETIAFFKTGRNRVFQGIEFGASGFAYNDFFAFNVPANEKGFELNNATSIHWSINPIEMDVRIISEYFKFSTGFGYSAKNYSFSNNYLLNVQNDFVTATEVDEPDFSRNRLRIGYLTVPTLFHLNTSSKPSQAVSFVFGAVTGIKLFETYRVKYVADGQAVRTNINRNWNVNQFNIDARAGIAYGGFQLFAAHTVTRLFRRGRGPQLYPFTVGLSVNTSFDK